MVEITVENKVHVFDERTVSVKMVGYSLVVTHKDEVLLLVPFNTVSKVIRTATHKEEQQ